MGQGRQASDCRESAGVGSEVAFESPQRHDEAWLYAVCLGDVSQQFSVLGENMETAVLYPAQIDGAVRPTDLTGYFWRKIYDVCL